MGHATRWERGPGSLIALCKAYTKWGRARFIDVQCKPPGIPPYWHQGVSSYPEEKRFSGTYCMTHAADIHTCDEQIEARARIMGVTRGKVSSVGTLRNLQYRPRLHNTFYIVLQQKIVCS